MKIYTPATIQPQIASGELDSAYLVLGDDEQEKTKLIVEFEQVIDEGLRAFNVDRFYGGETALGIILDVARTLPMIVQKRIVIVFRAELALQPKRESEASVRDLDALASFLKKPPGHVILILVSGPLDKRRRINKLLLSKVTVVQCGSLENVADGERWVRSRIKEAGKFMKPDAVRLLCETVGPNSNRLRDELERLLLFCKNSTDVSIEDVREVIGSTAVYDDWAIARSIERGETAIALKELGIALERGAIPHVVLGQLAWVARSRLSTNNIARAVKAVFRTDVNLKRSAGNSRILLERLVVELCEGPSVSSRASLGRR